MAVYRVIAMCPCTLAGSSENTIPRSVHLPGAAAVVLSRAVTVAAPGSVVARVGAFAGSAPPPTSLSRRRQRTVHSCRWPSPGCQVPSAEPACPRARARASSRLLLPATVTVADRAGHRDCAEVPGAEPSTVRAAHRRCDRAHPTSGVAPRRIGGDSQSLRGTTRNLIKHTYVYT
jgi:hypothetical protein